MSRNRSRLGPLSPGLKTRLSSLFRRERYERELDTELRFHIDMLTEQNVRAGMAVAEARQAALRNFGQVDRVKDDVRDTWLSRLWETLVQDGRYGLRNLLPQSRLRVRRSSSRWRSGSAPTRRSSASSTACCSGRCRIRTATSLSSCASSSRLPGVEDMNFSYQEILDYRTSKSLDGVVEFHDMWFILLGRRGARARVHGCRLGELLRRPRREAAVRAHLAGGRRRAGRAGRAAPEPCLLEEELWRGSNRRRQGLSDERPAAPGGRASCRRCRSTRSRWTSTCRRPRVRSARARGPINNRNFRIVRTAFARMKPGVTLEKAHADLSVVAVADPAGSPERVPDRTRLSHHGIPSAGRDDPVVPPHAARAPGHGCVRVAHRLRQHCEPDARQDGPARAGGRRPRGPRAPAGPAWSASS